MGIYALLLNALTIFVSIFFYQIFWLDKDDNKLRNDWLVSLLGSLALVICLSVPYEISTGYFYDLRLIPILLCFLYGGNMSKILISLVYVAYRYYLGGDGFYTSVFSFAIMLPILVLIGSKYMNFIKKKKVITAISVSIVWFILSTFIITMFQQSMNERLIELYVFYTLVSSITIWLSIYLIEGMIESRIRKRGLLHSEKINLLGDLASSIAHEIRNPLTVVSGFMQLLSKNQLSDQNKDEYIQLMMSELHRAEAIITDYLSLTKSGVDHQEQRINMMTLIGQVIEVITPYALMNNVEIRFSPTVPIFLTTNPVKMKQCLINIIKNGVEAMTAGGTLYIKAQFKHDDLLIEVIDTGVGMTEVEIQRLGLPFYSTKEKGTGIGTMVSYSIVQSLHGKIKVQSEKGKGTHFSIFIPLKINA